MTIDCLRQRRIESFARDLAFIINHINPWADEASIFQLLLFDTLEFLARGAAQAWAALTVAPSEQMMS